ncbi:MAG: methionine--tRNA ligase subunit beta [Deltaproteobacteria bacterium]|nr:methionine--tRNA ligase subunit beta [Deltaproteobacteria bacterium]
MTEATLLTPTATSAEPTAPSAPALMDITEFGKVELRIATITAAERVENADRLLKLQIDLGTEQRQLVAGIAQHYTPEELIGKQICVVANLKPAKLRGVESQGMLLAASDTATVSILTPLRPVAAGSKVK